MPDKVELTVEILENDGFNSPSPAFYCFVAEYENRIVGYAIYYYAYSSWLGKSVFCEDLYVEEPMRKHGIGQMLLTELAKVARETSGRLDFHVISWNPAVQFYEKLGAINLSNTEKWALYRFDKDSLDKLVEENKNISLI